MRRFVVVAALLFAQTALAWPLGFPTGRWITSLDPSDRTREVATLYARIAVNEDSRTLRAPVCGAPTEDHLAILQTGHVVAQIGQRALIDAFRRLSPRVAFVRVMSQSRHRWTATLPAATAATPWGWRECGSTKERCDGYWRNHGPCWEKFHMWARETVLAGVYEPPCPGSPRAWGGKMDDVHAVKRGLCRLACGELNRFWAKPGEGCSLEDEATREIYASVEN